MIPLNIDLTSSLWNAVKAYCSMRQSELVEIATSITVDDRTRSDAVQRLDELRMLVRAPEETLEATSEAFNAQGRNRPTY